MKEDVFTLLFSTGYRRTEIAQHSSNPAGKASSGTTVDVSSNTCPGPKLMWEREIHPPAKEVMLLLFGGP